MTTEKKFNRFQQALDVQNACNPSGVALLLVEVIKDAMADPNVRGTKAVCEDPAVALVVDKLSDMTGRIPFLMKSGADGQLVPTTKNYCNADEACRKLAENRNYGIAALRWFSSDVKVPA